MCQWALAVTPESSACGVKSELCCDSREIASNVEIMYSPQIHAFFFFFSLLFCILPWVQKQPQEQALQLAK